MARKKEDNLRPAEHKFTLEEHKKGGVASGIARRKKKSMRELASIVNSLPLPENNKKELLAKGVEGENANYQMAFVWQVYQKAMKGDVKAMKLWIELSDYMNDTKTELEIVKLRAETKILKLQQQQAQRGEATDIEDLTPLAELLKNDDV